MSVCASVCVRVRSVCINVCMDRIIFYLNMRTADCCVNKEKHVTAIVRIHVQVGS